MNQTKIAVQHRPETGKGAAGRMRKEGRVPGVLYGHDVEPTAVSVDALELYHALHGPAGRNVLLIVDIDDNESLCIARDIQRHPVKGHYIHIDLQSVDKNATILVDIPLHVTGEAAGAGVISQVLGTVPIHVAPLRTPNSFEISVEGLEIGEVVRLGDLSDQLPEGAEWDIDEDRTVVTINAPTMAEVDESADEAEEAEGEAAAPAADAEAPADEE